MAIYVTKRQATSKQWRCLECNMWLNGMDHYRGWKDLQLIAWCELHYVAGVLAKTVEPLENLDGTPWR